jgi:hypothetical protein
MIGVLILDHQGACLHALLEPGPLPLLPLATFALISCIEGVAQLMGLPHERIDHISARADRGFMMFMPIQFGLVLMAITTRHVLLGLTHAEMRHTVKAAQPYLLSDHIAEGPIRLGAEQLAEELKDLEVAGTTLWNTTQAIAGRVQLGTIDIMRIRFETKYLSVIPDEHQHVWIDVAADVFELGAIYRMRKGEEE